MRKMSTWFKLPVCCMPSEVGGWMEHVNFGVKGLSSHHCEAIEDAINNHDRLTEENAKLRDALQWTHEKLTEEGKRYGASTKRAEISKLLNQSKDQSNEK